MTVRELIQKLLEHDMDSEVIIRGNNGVDYETFDDIDVNSEGALFRGPDRIIIDFQTNGMAFIDNGELEQMQETIDELEEE